jgi:hypothetical protein
MSDIFSSSVVDRLGDILLSVAFVLIVMKFLVPDEVLKRWRASVHNHTGGVVDRFPRRPQG